MNPDNLSLSIKRERELPPTPQVSPTEGQSPHKKLKVEPVPFSLIANAELGEHSFQELLVQPCGFGDCLNAVVEAVAHLEKEALHSKLFQLRSEFLRVQPLEDLAIQSTRRQLTKRLKAVSKQELLQLANIPLTGSRSVRDFLNIYTVIYLQKVDALKKNPNEKERDQGFSKFSRKLSYDQEYDKAIKVATKIQDKELKNHTLFVVCRKMIKCGDFKQALEAYHRMPEDFDSKELLIQKFCDKLADAIADEFSGTSLSHQYASMMGNSNPISPNLTFACDLNDAILRTRVFRSVYSLLFCKEEGREENGEESVRGEVEDTLQKLLSSLSRSLGNPQVPFSKEEDLTNDEIYLALKDHLIPTSAPVGNPGKESLRREMALKIATLIEDEDTRFSVKDDILSSQVRLYQYSDPKKSFEIAMEISEDRRDPCLVGLASSIMCLELNRGTEALNEWTPVIEEIIEGINDPEEQLNSRFQFFETLLRLDQERGKQFALKCREINFVIKMLTLLASKGLVFEEISLDAFYKDKILYVESLSYLGRWDLARAMEIVERMQDQELQDVAYYSFSTVLNKPMYLPIFLRGGAGGLSFQSSSSEEIDRKLALEIENEKLTLKAYSRIRDPQLKQKALETLKDINPHIAMKIE
ncbi:MAG: hypothetical protein CK425_04935 [Parachlamydia sp.]|nr:MAG: hypothetical protein CK425_04935 [Parachlamydia sp.]